MIRKLTKEDHEVVLDYLSEEPSINLFIIGDIEAFGYDSDFQELWGEFDSEHTLKAVLLRYYKSFIPYSKTEFDVLGIANIIKSYEGPIFLSGKSDLVEKFEEIDGLNLGKKQVTYFAECRSDEQLTKDTSLDVKRAGFEDIERILEIRSTIEEFNMAADAREMITKAMESNTARTFYTEENGVITSCVSTTAENSLSAMIVGVCTLKSHRRLGLASGIMNKLFKEVLAEGKTLCLFYDNPEAGRIYKRLGFVDVGMWTMYR